MFKKFAETPLTLWIALAVVVALCVIFAALVKTRRKWNARMLASGALCVALSFVLSCIRLYRMPTGGSVTPGSMLPLMLFSVAYGAGPGLLAGLVYGVLQYLQGGWWLNVWQFLLDYILAFTVLGLAGIAHNKSEKWMYLSIPFAALMRLPGWPDVGGRHPRIRAGHRQLAVLHARNLLPGVQRRVPDP